MYVKEIKETIKGVGDIFNWILTAIMIGLEKKKIKEHVIAAITLGVIFGVIFCCCDLEMSKEAWFYVFSALPQTLAAFIAFGAMIFIYRLGREDDERKRIELIEELNIPYSLMITSTVLSIILLTFGQINNPRNWITNDYFVISILDLVYLSSYDCFKFLKYGISFFTISLGIFGMIWCAGKMIWESRVSIDKPLFNWNNVPGNDDEKLIGFIMSNFGINWIKGEKPNKSDDSKTISISKDKNSVEITIDDGCETATIKISDGRTCQLQVRKENDDLNIYRMHEE